MEKFWLEDPNVIFKNLNFIPVDTMTNVEKLNALTRLLLLITLGLYLYGYQKYYNVLAIGLVLIVLLKFQSNSSDTTPIIEGFAPKRGESCGNCGFDSDISRINAKYEVTPMLQFNYDNESKRSYTNAKYELIPLDVPQPYRDIWRNEPEYLNSYNMVPNPYTILPDGSGDGPHSQQHYITRSYVDIQPVSQTQTSLAQARPIVESAWMRDSNEFRNNIMGEYIDRFQRERQHNCSDIKVGRQTW